MSAKAEYPYLAVVVWDDAWSAGIEVLTLQEVAQKHHPSVMQTIGWVLKRDDKGVALANERCMDKGDECYRGHTFIPASLIKSVTPFRLSSPRKRKVSHEKSPADNPVGSVSGSADIR